jgi:hypothetical protein
VTLANALELAACWP